MALGRSVDALKTPHPESARAVKPSILARFLGRSERSQAAARIILTLLALLYLAVLYATEPGSSGIQTALLAAALYSTAATAWWLTLRRFENDRCAPAVRLRFGILADIVMITTGLVLAGSAAIGLYAMYIWLLFGNGYRFGTSAMRFATTCSVIGLSTAAFASPAWKIAPASSAGLVVGLVVIYLFHHHALMTQQAAEALISQHASEMQHLATHDALSGVANRRLFDWVVEDRERRKEPFALLLVDLNDFKRVNDTFGHDVGDALLRAVANRISCQIRQQSDLLARLGGDEFAIVLVDADEQMANNLMERLRKVLAQPFALSEGSTLQIGASVGYALWGEGIGSTDELFRVADRAMYHDKLLQQQAAKPVT